MDFVSGIFRGEVGLYSTARIYFVKSRCSGIFPACHILQGQIFFCYFFVVAFLWYRETAVRSQSSLVTKARYVIFFAFFSPNLRKKNGMMNGIIEGGGGGGGLAMFVFSVVFCRCSVSGPYFGGPLALPPTPYSTFDCRLTCHRKKTTDKDQSRVPTYTTLPSFTPPPILPHLTHD